MTPYGRHGKTFYIFDVGDKVQVEGVSMTVTAVMVRGKGEPHFCYETTWMNGRAACVQWFEACVVRPGVPDEQMVIGFGPVPEHGDPRLDKSIREPSGQLSHSRASDPFK